MLDFLTAKKQGLPLLLPWLFKIYQFDKKVFSGEFHCIWVFLREVKQSGGQLKKCSLVKLISICAAETWFLMWICVKCGGGMWPPCTAAIGSKKKKHTVHNCSASAFRFQGQQGIRRLLSVVGYILTIIIIQIGGEKFDSLWFMVFKAKSLECFEHEKWLPLVSTQMVQKLCRHFKETANNSTFGWLWDLNLGCQNRRGHYYCSNCTLPARWKARASLMRAT